MHTTIVLNGLELRGYKNYCKYVGIWHDKIVQIVSHYRHVPYNTVISKENNGTSLFILCSCKLQQQLSNKIRLPLLL